MDLDYQITDQLTEREDIYKRHAAQVDKFFATASAALDKDRFPSIAVARVDSRTGTLEALGTTFDIAFTFTYFDLRPFTVLEVALPATQHRDRQVCARWFVDAYGRVRDAADLGQFTKHAVDDSSFVATLVNRAELGFFQMMKEVS